MPINCLKSQIMAKISKKISMNLIQGPVRCIYYLIWPLRDMFCINIRFVFLKLILQYKLHPVLTLFHPAYAHTCHKQPIFWNMLFQGYLIVVARRFCFWRSFFTSQFDSSPSNLSNSTFFSWKSSFFWIFSVSSFDYRSHPIMCQRLKDDVFA